MKKVIKETQRMEATHGKPAMTQGNRIWNFAEPAVTLPA
jgi:hypothetical protein